MQQIVLILSLICVLVSVSSCERKKQTGSVIVGGQLSPKEISELERLAQTSAAAAMELSNYYYVTRRDMTNGIIWMRRAAELDESAAQFQVAVMLLHVGGEVNLGEAKRWLELAAAKGYVPAKRALKSNSERFANSLK